MREKKEEVNSSFCLWFWRRFVLFCLYLIDEMQSSQKTKNLLWDCMSTCLLHWKPDGPCKSPVLTTKMVALFLKGLTGQPGSLHKWKTKSVSSDERFLVDIQYASKTRGVAVAETRDSRVFLP